MLTCPEFDVKLKLKWKNIFIVSKTESFQNPQIPDSEMCVISASVKSSLKNTELRQAYQNLGSKLVTDHTLTLIRNFPTFDSPGVFDEL